MVVYGITTEEVQEAVEVMKLGKTPRSDCVAAECLTRGDATVIECLVRLLNVWVMSCEASQCFHCSVL